MRRANWEAMPGAQGLHFVAMYLPGLGGLLDAQPIGFGDWLEVA